jgi:hypothetical protein
LRFTVHGPPHGDGQIPHEPRMPTMLQQIHLLSRCWQESEPRHTCELGAATDTGGHREPTHVGIGFPLRYTGRGFPPRELL